MRDSEKIKILQETVQRLEKENAVLKKQIEDDKREILTMKTATGEKERQMEDVINIHREGIVYCRELEKNYRAAIRDAKQVQAEYEKRMKELLKRLKKQK